MDHDNRPGAHLAQHLIDGRWTAGDPRRTFTVCDPGDGTVVGEVPVATAAEVATAVGAAAKAAEGWRRTDPAARGALVKDAAHRLREQRGRLAELTTSEMGKPLDDAAGGVDAAIGTLEQYAELGPLHRGRSLAGGWDATDLMVHEPRGVVAAITPWNDPVAVPAGLLAAALVTGNTVVFKPSERAPHTGAALAEILADGLPPGVLNCVLGDGETGTCLAADPRVDLVAHVGSTRAGRAIAEATARTGAAALLENGGKDPLIVDAGVDPRWAAQQAALGCFANAGQICTAVERVYVHASLADQFTDALVAQARRRVPQPGRAPGAELGPLVDLRHREAVHGHVQAAVQDGARLLAGGEVPDGPGAYYPATVLADCREDMLVLREETFGPVAPLREVASFDEALRLAADGDYGLAATVLTADLRHAQRAVRELPVGTVKVNAVFGGAPGGAAQPRRASGRGFGYGPELLEEMTTTKVVHLALPPGAGT